MGRWSDRVLPSGEPGTARSPAANPHRPRRSDQPREVAPVAAVRLEPFTGVRSPSQVRFAVQPSLQAAIPSRSASVPPCCSTASRRSVRAARSRCSFRADPSAGSRPESQQVTLVAGLDKNVVAPLQCHRASRERDRPCIASRVGHPVDGDDEIDVAVARAPDEPHRVSSGPRRCVGPRSRHRRTRRVQQKVVDLLRGDAWSLIASTNAQASSPPTNSPSSIPRTRNGCHA